MLIANIIELIVMICLLCHIKGTENRIRKLMFNKMVQHAKEKQESYNSGIEITKKFIKMNFEKAKTPEEFCGNTWKWLNEDNNK